MDLTLSSPALLFPTISLMLLAYTNRFIALSNLIRQLHKEYQDKCDTQALRQIKNLRFRVILIRWMQAAGVMSLLACVLCMFLIFCGAISAAEWTFMVSLALMVGSLFFSLWEIQMSTQALDIVLSDLEKHGPKEKIENEV